MVNFHLFCCFYRGCIQFDSIVCHLYFIMCIPSIVISVHILPLTLIPSEIVLWTVLDLLLQKLDIVLWENTSTYTLTNFWLQGQNNSCWSSECKSMSITLKSQHRKEEEQKHTTNPLTTKHHTCAQLQIPLFFLYETPYQRVSEQTSMREWMLFLVCCEWSHVVQRCNIREEITTRERGFPRWDQLSHIGIWCVICSCIWTMPFCLQLCYLEFHAASDGQWISLHDNAIAQVLIPTENQGQWSYISHVHLLTFLVSP
jgi:RsiW-degrading membrane proteinase PrsW (M82 family)